MNRSTFENANKEVLNEETIINTILINRKFITFEENRSLGDNFPDYEQEDEGVYRILLQYGSKVLVITVDTNKESFSTFINTLDSNKRKQRETSYLYKAAHMLMQEIVECENKEYAYSLCTKNEQMARWADVNGKNIFQWTEKESFAEGTEDAYYAFKTFLKPHSKA